MRRTRSNGFTLVELTVTVGVIVALLALLLPLVFSARRQAWELQCTVNLHRIASYLTAYACDNGSHFPLNVGVPAPGKFWYDPARMAKYVSDDFRLPSGKVGGGFLACPADPGGRRSYAMNLWASGGVDGARLLGDPPRGRLFGANAPHASTLILATETWSSTG